MNLSSWHRSKSHTWTPVSSWWVPFTHLDSFCVLTCLSICALQPSPLLTQILSMSWLVHLSALGSKCSLLTWILSMSWLVPLSDNDINDAANNNNHNNHNNHYNNNNMPTTTITTTTTRQQWQWQWHNDNNDNNDMTTMTMTTTMAMMTMMTMAAVVLWTTLFLLFYHTFRTPSRLGRYPARSGPPRLRIQLWSHNSSMTHSDSPWLITGP